MKKFLLALLMMLFASFSKAQTTAITATVVDSDGTAWVKGTWSIAFQVSPNNSNIGAYNINGVPLDPNVISQKGSMSGTGALTATVYDNTKVTPSGSSWNITVCPIATGQCGTYNFKTTATPLDLSSAITGVITAPRFIAISGTYGYTDVEAAVSIGAGSTYYNVISACQRFYDYFSQSWACGGGGSGGGPGGNPAGADTQVQFNQVGAFGASTGLTFNYLTGMFTAANLTVPGTSNIHLPSSGVTWPPACVTGTYVPSTNTCVATGTASNPGGSAPQIQYNAGGTFGGVAGSSGDASGNIKIPQMVSANSPMADIRAYGAVLDATHTPIDSALTAAVNNCNAANSNSCQVLLPCGGPDGCFISNGSTALPTTPAGKTVELNLQGTLTLQSTLKVPSNYSIYGKGAGGAGQFQSFGADATIQGPSNNGTIGTPVPGVTTGTITNGSTSLTVVDPTNHIAGEAIKIWNNNSAGVVATLLYTGTVSSISGNVLTVSPAAASNITNMTVAPSSVFTPTVSASPSTSNFANFHVNSVIGISGVQTCTAVSASRDNTIAYNQPNTVFSAGAPITQVSVTGTTTLNITANNTFTVGQSVGLVGFKQAALLFLNGQTVTIATQTPTGFTANLSHANVTLAYDSGTATTCTSSSGTPESIRMPVGQTVLVSCPNDSTFNQNQTIINGQDWPNSTISVYEAGATATTTGCTITGFDDYNYEIARIDAVSGTTLTATFAHPHAAGDLWGMGSVSTSDSPAALTGHLDLQGLRIAGGYGPQLWLDNAATINLTGVAVYPQYPPGYPASSGIECDGCWWGQWNSIQAFAGTPIFSCTGGTVTNCKTPSYPWGLRCSQDALRRNGIGCATNLTIRDLTAIGGIKVDGNGMDSSAGSGWNMVLSSYVAEQGYEGAILVDNSKGLGGDLHIYSDMIIPSDSYIKNEQHTFAATDCCLNGAFANLGTLTFQTRFLPLTNKYWLNGVSVGGGVGGVTNPIINPAAGTLHTSAGVLTDGSTIVANIRGSGANLSPSLIPFPTLPMTVNPTCATYCFNVPGPDGVAGSAIEVQSQPAGTQVILIVGNINVKTWTGDWIIAGVTVSPGTNVRNQQPASPLGQNNLFYLRTGSTTELLQGGSNTYSTPIPTNNVNSGGLLPLTADSWQPGINVITVVQGDQSLHGISLNVISGSGASGGNKFWDPWIMIIPGPNNPGWSNAGVTYPGYDGVTTRQDVMRIARELLHGYVPPNAPSGGGILATCPGCRYLNLAVAAARRGTFVCTAGGTITVANANAIAGSDITFSLNTLGGTITTAPAMKTPGNGTNFQVLCGATDTSTYNYAIWN